jgi:hypothetical protein
MKIKKELQRTPFFFTIMLLKAFREVRFPVPDPVKKFPDVLSGNRMPAGTTGPQQEII